MGLQGSGLNQKWVSPSPQKGKVDIGFFFPSRIRWVAIAGTDLPKKESNLAMNTVAISVITVGKSIPQIGGADAGSHPYDVRDVKFGNVTGNVAVSATASVGGGCAVSVLGSPRRADVVTGADSTAAGADAVMGSVKSEMDVSSSSGQHVQGGVGLEFPPIRSGSVSRSDGWTFGRSEVVRGLRRSKRATSGGLTVPTMTAGEIGSEFPDPVLLVPSGWCLGMVRNYGYGPNDLSSNPRQDELTIPTTKFTMSTTSTENGYSYPDPVKEEIQSMLPTPSGEYLEMVKDFGYGLANYWALYPCPPVNGFGNGRC